MRPVIGLSLGLLIVTAGIADEAPKPATVEITSLALPGAPEGYAVDDKDRTLRIGAATLTLAHLDEKGVLHVTASIPTSQGARNAVVTEEGVACIADGPEGKIVVVRPPHGT